ncbi:unnamed protein product [Strongylus vulgaris]|uniref:Uncharacterized protein n=1 Tax=Strongylus vulgaris TaxID=40348 RepID=A0A3P7KE77_STRVU|nr:unnamed protein product [Strongylus vulgaris]
MRSEGETTGTSTRAYEPYNMNTPPTDQPSRVFNPYTGFSSSSTSAKCASGTTSPARERSRSPGTRVRFADTVEPAYGSVQRRPLTHPVKLNVNQKVPGSDVAGFSKIALGRRLRNLFNLHEGILLMMMTSRVTPCDSLSPLRAQAVTLSAAITVEVYHKAESPKLRRSSTPSVLRMPS